MNEEMTENIGTQEKSVISQPKKRKIARDIFERIIDVLYDLYPGLFSKEKMLPLKKGIDKDILSDPRFVESGTSLRGTLFAYTRSTRYLQAVIRLRERYNIHGELVEAITQNELRISQMLLESKLRDKEDKDVLKKQTQKKTEDVNQPIIVVRNGKKRRK